MGTDSRPLTASIEQQKHADRLVDAFAEGWRASAGDEDFIDHLRPWLAPDYRFTQPLSRCPGTGWIAFRDRFARPIFSVLGDVHGSVDSWARTGDTVFIALRLEPTLGRRRVTIHACEQVRLAHGQAAERFTYADVTPLLRAVIRTPRMWPRLLRWQLDEARTTRRSR